MALWSERATAILSGFSRVPWRHRAEGKGMEGRRDENRGDDVADLWLFYDADR
jgi:hypothetical protein